MITPPSLIQCVRIIIFWWKKKEWGKDCVDGYKPMRSAKLSTSDQLDHVQEPNDDVDVENSLAHLRILLEEKKR